MIQKFILSFAFSLLPRAYIHMYSVAAIKPHSQEELMCINNPKQFLRNAPIELNACNEEHYVNIDNLELVDLQKRSKPRSHSTILPSINDMAKHYPTLLPISQGNRLLKLNT
jgi:hypothetical protein